MANAPLAPLPPPNAALASPNGQGVAQGFAQYLQSLDALVRALALGNIGPLTSAANDAGAAAAGVAIGGLYQNSGAVRIRLT
jgi:hypothetical protein